jgi:hypothetical protein
MKICYSNLRKATNQCKKFIKLFFQVIRLSFHALCGIFLFVNALAVLPNGILRYGDHSPPSSAEVKECVELYLRSPIRLHGVVLS